MIRDSLVALSGFHCVASADPAVEIDRSAATRKAGQTESTTLSQGAGSESTLAFASAGTVAMTCGPSVVAVTSQDYDALAANPYIKNKVESTISLTRSQCGREIRGDILIKGWSLSPRPLDPMVKIAKRLVNGCKMTASNTQESFSGGVAACGARTNFTWTVNGITATKTETDGCGAGYSMPPTDSDVVTETKSGCKYPPEPLTAQNLLVPTLDQFQMCNGGYIITWDAIPSATKYEVMAQVNGSGYSLAYSGPARNLGTKTKPYSVATGYVKEIWVRACTAAGCGFYSEPMKLTYFKGCTPTG